MTFGGPPNVPEPTFDALYRDVILDHYRDPRGRDPLPREDVRVEGMNPLCGDELELAVAVDDDGRCSGLQVHAMGCAISVASGSILHELVEGVSVEEAERILAAVRDVMHGGDYPADPDLGDFDALEGVKQFPVRIKCALLPWTTLEEAFKELRAKRVDSTPMNGDGS